LPIGLAEGCTLTRDIPKDSEIRYADIRLPGGRAVERLRAEQDQQFFGSTQCRAKAAVETAFSN
jgi:predicted homoserine dehydrogenase-like protein